MRTCVRERRGPRRNQGTERRTRPRVITSPVGAELSPPTRGAHRAAIGRGSLPRKRSRLRPRLLFRFSSPPNLSRYSRQSPVSLPLFLCLFPSPSPVPLHSSQLYVVSRFPGVVTVIVQLSIFHSSALPSLHHSRRAVPSLFFPVLSFFTHFPVSLSERSSADCPRLLVRALNAGAEWFRSARKTTIPYRIAPPAPPTERWRWTATRDRRRSRRSMKKYIRNARARRETRARGNAWVSAQTSLSLVHRYQSKYRYIQAGETRNPWIIEITLLARSSYPVGRRAG